MPARSPGAAWRSPLVVIAAGCLIAMIGFGIRSIFGLFLDPMILDRGWDRETFGLAMAIQNLLWGIGVPVAGAIADRFGPARVLAGGAVVYMAGVWGMAEAESAVALWMTGGVLTGLGVAFTAFSLAMASMAKVVGPERRSLALGLGTAAGSFGQVVFSPVGQGFIHAFGWHQAMLVLAGSALLIIPLAFVLPRDQQAKGEPRNEQTLRAALAEAGAHRGYVLLTLGFFVCGFHVSFIAVYFPSYVASIGLDPAIGAYSLSLIGLFNIAGAFMSGMLGQRYSKKCGLSGIYLARAVTITIFLLAPKTVVTIYVFSACMGLLWLSTVPLTTGIVAQIFGVRYMATLFGIVFLSHQIGSFSGVWLGGYLYDTIGSYDGVWWAGVVLGLAAAVVHLPIDEKPLARLTPAPAAA
ncbi:MAG: MFS transporter [Ectothiorhodospiraceae bacterium]|nr:MFS transporter [Ectothiorhodospiraceae bacterium]